MNKTAFLALVGLLSAVGLVFVIVIGRNAGSRFELRYEPIPGQGRLVELVLKAKK